MLANSYLKNDAAIALEGLYCQVVKAFLAVNI